MKHGMMVMCAAVLASALGLGGCMPAPSQAQGDQRVAQKEKSIDWQAAQKDAPPPSPVATAPRGSFNAQVATASVGAPVPMLAPPSTASIAAGLDDTSATVRVTQDGYFANFPGPRYDVTIHGTKAFYVAPENAPQTQPGKAAAPAATGYRYEVSEGEVSVMFSRYGADYMIQFSCKTGAPNAACISQADAFAFADRLQLVNQ